MNVPPAPEHHVESVAATQDRAVNVIGVLTLCVTIGVLILAAISVPVIFGTANNADQVAKGTELAACRAEIRSQVDIAIGQVMTAKAELDVLTNEALEALMRDDDQLLAAIVADAPAKRDAVTAAITDLETATAAYAQATTASVEDPDQFLEDCDSR